MKLYNRNNIINLWDDVLSKEDWDKLYDEVKKEVLTDILKEKYVDLIMNNGQSKLNNKLKKVLNDDLSE